MAGPGKGDKGGAARAPSTEKPVVTTATETPPTGGAPSERDSEEARLFAELEAEERRLAEERKRLEEDRERLEQDRERLLAARDETAQELDAARARLNADRQEFERMLEQWREHVEHVEASRQPRAITNRGPGRYRVAGPGSVMVAGRLHHAGEVLTLAEKDARSLGAAVIEE